MPTSDQSSKPRFLWLPRVKGTDNRQEAVGAGPAEHGGWLARALLLASIVLLATLGYVLFSQSKNYSYLSIASLLDIIRVKLWSLGWLLVSVVGIFALRRHRLAPLVVVFAVSAYFLIQYGYLFRGSEFGLNGHWGDNGNRLAEIKKMMAYKSFFQDWYLKDLPSFYPPGWFALMAVYAKIMGIEAYQTIKWGYYLIWLVYPWLLYWSWRKLLSPVASAATVVVVLFFSWQYMSWVYYESITAALFIPWWTYYIERGFTTEPGPRFLSWREYVAGSLIGGALFMTYYYWFFVAAVVTPLIWAFILVSTKSFRQLWYDVRHKAIMVAGVALVSSPYWAPLLLAMRRYGSESAQHQWFGSRHMNLTHQWPQFDLQVALIFAGIFAAGYLWKRFAAGRLVFFLAGMVLVLLLDRVLNLDLRSFQSRKVIEFVHVFAMMPLGVLMIELWQKAVVNSAVQRGLFGVGLIAAIVACNAHTEVYNDSYYKVGIGTRVPKADLAAFDAVNTYGTVFLTDRYIETVYLPYYLFIPLNNMTAHTAGRYSQREEFLKQAALISEPEILAYALKYNRYSPIDYLYLPTDSITHKPKITLYQAGFDKLATGVTYKFSCDIAEAPGWFIKRQDRGIFEIAAPERSEADDAMLKSAHPDVYAHLEPLTSSR